MVENSQKMADNGRHGRKMADKLKKWESIVGMVWNLQALSGKKKIGADRKRSTAIKMPPGRSPEDRKRSPAIFQALSGEFLKLKILES